MYYRYIIAMNNGNSCVCNKSEFMFCGFEEITLSEFKELEIRDHTRFKYLLEKGILLQ